MNREIPNSNHLDMDRLASRIAVLRGEVKGFSTLTISGVFVGRQVLTINLSLKPSECFVVELHLRSPICEGISDN